MVLEHEFADASPQEREQWMARLARSSEADVPRLLAERRRRRDGLSGSNVSDAAVSGETTAPAATSAQQIILTSRPRQAEQSSTADSPQKETTPPRTKRHPLLDDDSPLAAPTPGGGRIAPPDVKADVETLSNEEPAAEKGMMATVFDAFGVGGETRAARQEVAGASSIKLAEPADPAEEETRKAEAIARDLEKAKNLQSVFWQEDLDKLIVLLETQVAQQKPGETEVGRELYIRQHVALRMLYLIANRRPEALQAIPSVPQQQQEFWTQMFWALSNTFDDEALPNPAVRAAATVAQLRAAVEQIETQSALELLRTRFCRQIDGFGEFVTFENDSFTPGQPVLIYTEVRNFQSESTPQGDYRTVLRSSLAIREESAKGPVVFEVDLPETEDRCFSRRQDYFHSYRIELPSTLKPGPHVLTLEMTDDLTGKTGSTTLNFVVR